MLWMHFFFKWFVTNSAIQSTKVLLHILDCRIQKFGIIQYITKSFVLDCKIWKSNLDLIFSFEF